MELEERKRKLLEEITKYYPEEKQQVENILKNLTEETLLIQYIIRKEQQINNHKKEYTNKAYADTDGSTYYADIEEDEKIYDPIIPEEKEEIEKSLEKATKDYLEVDPKTVHDEKDYGNFIKGEIVYDTQIGYRVIENEHGLFHIIQRESSYFIYPSSNINLNIPDHVEICNALFKNQNNKEFKLGDEIELDGVIPAEIFTPFVAVIDDPVNKLNMSDILISEGVNIDNNFKNSKFKDINLPGLKNTVTKGTIKSKTKVNEDFRYQEELILEPTKYIDGTFIPQPREQKPDESYVHYTEYLKNIMKDMDIK